MVNLVDSALEFWLTSGRYTDQFEAGLANYLGVKYCSLVNSGSSANLIAFMALTSPLLGERRVCRGDEIITVAAGFPTTVTPAIQYGAVPVFVDVTIPQYNIDADKLEAAYSEKTKAVMIAHTLGNPFDLQKVKEFCDRHNLWLVEDNCDALGSRYELNGEWHIYRYDRRYRNVQLLSAAPHDDGRGRRRVHGQSAFKQDYPFLPRLGTRLCLPVRLRQPVRTPLSTVSTASCRLATTTNMYILISVIT